MQKHDNDTQSVAYEIPFYFLSQKFDITLKVTVTTKGETITHINGNVLFSLVSVYNTQNV